MISNYKKDGTNTIKDLKIDSEKKYVGITYSMGNIIEQFETDDFSEMKKFYSLSLLQGSNVSIRVYENLRKMTYSESNRMFISKHI